MRVAIRLAAWALVAALLALPAHAGDASGKWAAEFDTQVGVQKYTYDLHVEEGKLTGTAHFERMGQAGDVDLVKGKVEGDHVSFVEMLDFQGNQIEITYEGTVSVDEIAFTRRVGDFATEEFKARRLAD